MRSIALLFVSALLGCGGSPAPAPSHGGPPGDAPPSEPEGPPKLPELPPGDPFALDGLVREEQLPLLSPAAEKLARVDLGPLPEGVSKPSAACEAFAQRAAGPAPACADRASSLEALDAAMRVTDPAERDAKLAGLEACKGLSWGIVRAIRAELAPPECGDALVVPLLATPPDKAQPAVYHALLGLAMAARLDRAVDGAPSLSPPFTKARVQVFVKGPMLEWVERQARAVEAVAAAGAKLPYYGKGIVAVSAGLADLRLVQAIRDVPIPDEFKKDAELADAYYASLDVALEPRKARGRDAALVGLREMAHVGAIRDHRVEAARVLLSTLYGGRRVDALDELVLPPRAVPAPATAAQRLARSLPAFYAGLLLDPKLALDEAVLSQMLEQGLSVPHRAALRDAELSPALRSLVVRARLELGRRYWRAVDFDLAAAAAKAWPAGVARPDDTTLLFALALALRGGPDDVVDMMVKAPAGAMGVGKTAALDSITRDGGAMAGWAAYDAALVRQIGAPVGAEAAYWRDLGERYRLAASLLPPGMEQDEARERAKAALATAKEIESP